MQFEEFDNKVREAAENHHPAYDEKAWAGMEKLLDKHLPQEKDDRRRFVFFLLLFLVLGGAGVWLFSSKPGQGNKQMTTAKTTLQQSTGDISAPVASNKENSSGDNNTLNKKEVTGINMPDNSNKVTNPSSPGEIAVFIKSDNKKDRQSNLLARTGINNNVKFDKRVLRNSDPGPADKNIKKNWMDKDYVDAITSNKSAATLIPDQKKKDNQVAAGTDLTTITTHTKPVDNEAPDKENTNKDNHLLVQHSPEKKTMSKNKKGNSFFFTLSAGPDLSATPGDQVGKTRMLVGAGLGYSFKDRLIIRSGFYTARKIYTSSPGSYHPPANFWNYYPNLEKVDADCKVYEIPLSLSYQFGHSSKQNWFVSAGLSSYLMKKETYKYYYKNTPGGQTLTRQYTPQDKNNNYFSVLTLSGGYQKNIGKSFSVSVEPYVKLPLSGVGLGKVKLNSGGILFSVGIKPFAHTKKMLSQKNFQH